MITLITYLTWPKQVTFHGLSYETLQKMIDYINGPDYNLTVFLDLTIVIIIVAIIAIKWVNKTSSK